MKSNLRIVSAEYLKDYQIEIRFSDNTCNIFDYKPMVTSGHEEFSKYLDVTKFKEYSVVNGGYSISWGEEWDMILPIKTLYSKSSFLPKKTKKKVELSVSEFAAKLQISRQAVLKKIKNKTLPKNAKARLVGKTWIIELT